MFYLTNSKPLVTKEYQDFLDKNKFIYLDKTWCLLAVNYDSMLIDSMKSELNSLISYYSKDEYKLMNRESIFYVLKNIIRIRPDELKIYSKENRARVESLDSKNLTLLYNTKYKHEFLDIYLRYAGLFTKYNKLVKELDRAINTNHTTHEGDPVTKLTYSIEYAITGRAYTNNSNVQSFPKIYLNAMCSVDGRILAKADLGSADLTIACETILKSPKLSEYIKKYDNDRYEAFARYMFYEIGKEFDYEQYLLDRPKYKVAILATMYLDTVEEVAVRISDFEFAKQLRNFFDNCKVYQQFLTKCKKMADTLSIVRIYDYFGKEMVIDGNDKHYLNKCIACCIQSTVNTVIEFVVVELKKTVGKDFNEELIRHDEPVVSFMSKEDILKLRAFETIIIDDLTPLKLKWDFGYHYYDVDEELSEYYNKYAKDYDIGKPEMFKHHPMIKSTDNISIYGDDKSFIILNETRRDYVFINQAFNQELLVKYCINKQIGCLIVNTEYKMPESVYVDGIYLFKRYLNDMSLKRAKEEFFKN